MASEEGAPQEVEEISPKVRVITPIEGLEAGPAVAPTGPDVTRSNVCAYHPGMPAVYICSQCSKSMCMNCAIPYGQLFLCPQCYIPPQVTAVQHKDPPLSRPARESILELFGGLLIIVGFFLPWATSQYISPGGEVRTNTIISGFVIMSDYPEVALILTMGVLAIIIEFVLIIVATSPTSAAEPPIGVRLVPMFLGLIAYIILAEVALRAESFIANVHVGWFICVFAATLILLGGALQIWRHYKGEDA
jgi:hypothetical protein